jgi:hypothetical protein
VARIVFDPAEADRLREAAQSEFPGSPGLAYVLERLADQGIDLDACRPWDEIRTELGLPDAEDGPVSHVA